jgi:hypothetical protein
MQWGIANILLVFADNREEKRGRIVMKINDRIVSELRQTGNSAAMTTPHPDRFSSKKERKK